MYTYKEDLELNNLQWLIWHKNQTKKNQFQITIYIYIYNLLANSL